MSNPKRHHYLPDFFLRGFGDGERLAVFDLEKNECRIQSTRNIAVIGHYYSFEWEDGTRDDGIEKMLSRIEGRAKPVIERLDKRLNINNEDRVNLAYFLAFLIVRTPRHEKSCADVTDIGMKHLTKSFFPTPAAVYSYFKNTSEEMTQEQARFFHDFVHEERYIVKPSRNAAIVETIDRAQEITPHIMLMDWLVVHTLEDKPFVLSDAPLGFIIDEKDLGTGEPVLGLLSDRVVKVVPLSTTSCLLMVSVAPKAKLVHLDIADKEVDQLNTAVIQESERIIVGKDEKSVTEAIQKASLTRRGGSKMRLDEIPHPTDPLRSLLVMHRTQIGHEKIPLTLDTAAIWADLNARKRENAD
jgi:hypothetical protein